MRLRNWQAVEYTQGAGELFEITTPAFFIRYTGKMQAKIYIKNDGFHFVHLSQIRPAAEVAT